MRISLAFLFLLTAMPLFAAEPLIYDGLEGRDVVGIRPLGDGWAIALGAKNAELMVVDREGNVRRAATYGALQSTFLASAGDALYLGGRLTEGHKDEWG